LGKFDRLARYPPRDVPAAIPAPRRGLFGPETRGRRGSKDQKERNAYDSTPGKNLLLHRSAGLYSRPFNQLEIIMARICAITGRRPSKGSIINRKGQSKKSGGIGTHVTSITKRKFRPNLQRIRIRTANGGTKRVWVSVKALKGGLVEKV